MTRSAGSESVDGPDVDVADEYAQRDLLAADGSAAFESSVGTVTAPRERGRRRVKTGRRAERKAPRDISVVEHLGSEPPRLRGWRGSIAAFLVLLALGAVAVVALVAFRASKSDTPTADNAPSVGTSAAAAGAPAASAAPTTAAPAAPAPAAPAPTQAPATNVAGKATASGVTVSFNLSDINLKVGKSVGISISAAGPATDKVQDISVRNADNEELIHAAVAVKCAGPALPWSASYPITFKQAESTELRVTITTCSGVAVTATSLADIQP